VIFFTVGIRGFAIVFSGMFTIALGGGFGTEFITVSIIVSPNVIYLPGDLFDGMFIPRPLPAPSRR
jgi:predicted Rossmann-fold nucleotide-binding protein